VQPGASYDFSVGWAAMLRDTGGGHNTKVDDVVIRRVGYDPTGGTNPQSPNVQWGPEVGTGSSGRSLNHPDMRITFKALANQVSVFVRVYNLSTSASDKVFFDVMCLLPRGDIPVENIEPSPTPTSPATDVPPTRVPPTRVPATRVPPTETPIPPTPVPAQVLTATPQKLSQRQATPTPEARPFIPRIAGSSDASASDTGGSGLSPLVIFGALGIVGISLLGIVLIGGFAVWRIFMRQVDDALDPAYYPDDQQRHQ
jgi:hypothetical protein